MSSEKSSELFYGSYSRHYTRTGGTQPVVAVDRRLLRHLPARKDAAILDIGCGSGRLLNALADLGYENLTGIDVSPDMISWGKTVDTRGRLRLFQADAREYLAKSQETFDCILLFDVVEHMPAGAAAELLKCSRMRLAPGGLLVVHVPNMSCLTATHMFYSDVTHERGYTEFSLSQLFDAAGFPSSRVLCARGRFDLRAWRPWRPLTGTSLVTRMNHAGHRLAYWLTSMGPRPQCFCPTLLMIAETEFPGADVHGRGGGTTDAA